MALLLTAAAVIAFIYLVQKLLSRKKSKNLPPGPRALPIIGHLHLLGKNPHQSLYHLANKHGPIMYMKFGSMPTIVASSPESAELFLKTFDHICASRPPHQCSQIISYGQRNVTFSPYGPYWRNMRKVTTLELLSNLRINQFRPMRQAELGLMVNSIKRSAELRETVDLSSKVARLSSDMTCLMVFGRKYDDKELSDKKGFHATITEMLEYAANTNLGDFFPILAKLDIQGFAGKVKALSDIFDDFLEKIIEDHVQTKKENKGRKSRDFVDVMLDVMESGEYEFTHRYMKAMLLDIFTAAMDTSSTATDWVLSELFRNPTVMKKVQKELEQVVGLDNVVDESHLDQLEYLNCVVKETLRIHPVGPLLIPHEAMEDCVIGGYHVPKNTRIVVNVYSVARDPKAWSDPHTFIPERFINSPVDVKGRDFQLLPFGSGRRGCPGMQLGLTVVRLEVAQLMHCFDWELPNGMEPSQMNMSDHFGLVTRRAENLVAVPTYRLNK